MKSKQEATELLKKVRRIEIKARGLSEQVFAGQYHSAFRGRGMAFSEVRNYQIGDDVRDIDWNVTARYAHPFVKVFEEERELTVMLLVDMTGSTAFGTQSESIRELNTELAATLAFSAIQNNDKVGAIFFTDHILYLIRELLSFEPKSQGTDLNVPLSYLNQVIKRRCTAFLISDFLHWGADYRTSLSLAARRHDLVAIRTYDAGAMQLPRLGLVQLQDAESGRCRWVDTSSRSLREAYEQQLEAQLGAFHQNCLRSGVDHIELVAGQDYTPELLRLFGRRS